MKVDGPATNLEMRLVAWRERRDHRKLERKERKRFYTASRPPGTISTRSFAIFASVVMVLFLLLAGGFALLYYRTAQVCNPLRAGESVGPKATTVAGKDYARIFGDAADHLGCGGR